MPNKRYSVLVFSLHGLTSNTFEVKGIVSTNLKFVKFQSQWQKKFRKTGTPIAIGVKTISFGQIKWDILEWVVPWEKPSLGIPEQEHNHLQFIEGNKFYDN
jgi:hypothetical protein